MAPAATTTELAQLACHSGGACCGYGLQSLCMTVRCSCRQAGRNCVSCWCLVQCANVAPQTHQDKQRTTQGGPGDGEVQREGKRRRGRGRGAAAKAQAREAGRVAHAKTNKHASGQRYVLRPPAQPGTVEKERRRGDAYATVDPVEGGGASGDVPRYVPTPEDLRLWEVYGDWVHGNPVTHLDGSVTDDSA